MNKAQAAQILNLDVTAGVAQSSLRYAQICAFLDGNTSQSSSITELLNKTKLQIDDAYNFFEHVETAKNEAKAPALDDKTKIDTTSGSTSFLFPIPKELAGAPFSEQWWKVYKRVVLLGCGVSALALYEVPKMLRALPTPQPQRPYVEPYLPSIQTPQTGSGNPSTIIGAPPGETDKNGSKTGSSSWPSPGIDTSLNPTPNASPLVIAPSQSPSAFLFGVFWSLKQSGNTASMIKQPPTPGVAQMLIKNFSLAPRLDQLPPDAIQVLTQSAAAATLRVNESYFTGIQVVNDYFLVSDNGVWKVADVQPVGGGFR